MPPVRVRVRNKGSRQFSTGAIVLEPNNLHKILVYTLYNDNGNTSEKSLYLNLTHRKVWLCFIKLTADKFLTHLCLDKCKQGTMKSLEIRIASFCELFQNRFYFKDVQHELSSWSVRKFWSFWFHCIINMNNNYHQTVVAVCLMTYIHVTFSRKKFHKL